MVGGAHDKARLRPVGLAATDELALLSGLEIVEAMGEGRLPMPPMAAVLPIAPKSWSMGAVEFTGVPEARFSNPMGTVHGGWAMTMLDTALAVAAQTTLRRGEVYVSLETAVKFLRPIVEKHGEMRILAEVVSRARRVITMQGRIEGSRGRIFATATSSCLVTSAARDG